MMFRAILIKPLYIYRSDGAFFEASKFSSNISILICTEISLFSIMSNSRRVSVKARQ